MSFLPGTKRLEDEIRDLKAKIVALEQRNHELTMACINRSVAPLAKTESAPVQKKHSITNTETRATCTCGWIHVDEDPASLQFAVAQHNRDATVSRGRKSWPQVKAMLESTGETQ